MIQLSGIFSESLGGTCTIRGYAKYNEIVELSYPHPGYQRPAEDEHVAEISSFITSGSNSFSPEVVLAYTAKYNYYAQGASSEVDALADIRSGKGFTSNVDGIAFKKEKAAGNGFLYTLSIPDKKYDRIEDKTIFMSRCFSAEYNETENAIRRAINEINNEKKTGIMLIRVDEHHEGTTGQISDRIFRDIESAGLVIADLSSGKLKVLQPIGSVFEHSNQQKRFFTKEKFDEKFQKRIDYFSKVAMSFFANHGYDTEGFTINPYMVVNKVFSSYYKHVQFPIVTFDELKREIQL